MVHAQIKAVIKRAIEDAYLIPMLGMYANKLASSKGTRTESPCFRFEMLKMEVLEKINIDRHPQITSGPTYTNKFNHEV
jgi:hypothetical protein